MTKTKSRKCTLQEHEQFIKLASKHQWGKWSEISEEIESKDSTQLRTHVINTFKRMAAKYRRGRLRKSLYEVLDNGAVCIANTVRSTTLYKDEVGKLERSLRMIHKS